MLLNPGDEVLIPSFTFVATANSVFSTGAKPVFVDILKENFNNSDDLQKKITKNTKAIVPVHLYGNVAYLDRISEIAKKFNIPIIEDSAQSLGSTFKKKHTGHHLQKIFYLIMEKVDLLYMIMIFLYVQGIFT